MSSFDTKTISDFDVLATPTANTKVLVDHTYANGVVETLSVSFSDFSEAAADAALTSGQITALRLTQFAAPNTALSMAGYKLTNLDAPTANTDGATKLYVDTTVAGKLAIASNLSDLANTAAARTNLGLGSLATLSTIDTDEITDGAVTMIKLATSGTASNTTYLRGDGSWATSTASPGGSSGAVQYNNAGSFDGLTGLTVSAGVLTAMALSQGIITSAAAQIDGSVTWDNSGVTFTGWKLNVTDTASASASLLMDLQVGGLSRWAFAKNAINYGGAALLGQIGASTAVMAPTSGGVAVILGPSGISSPVNAYAYVRNGVTIASTSAFAFANGADTSESARDVILARDAANTLALRNSTSAQIFNVYNTYTDGSNYERAAIGWATNNFFVETGQAGTGSQRPLNLGGSVVNLRTGATNRWQVDTSGHFLAVTDNTYDIGASGNSPRNIRAEGSVFSSGFRFLVGGGSSGLLTRMSAPADGDILITNDAASTFGKIQFGGTTSSFPALKRSTTSLQARLADDSAFTNIQGKLTTDTAYTATPQTCTGYLTMYDSTGTAYKVMVST